MAIGKADALKGARLGAKKKRDDMVASAAEQKVDALKDDSLQSDEGYKKYMETPEAERSQTSPYALVADQEAERVETVETNATNKGRRDLASGLQNLSRRGALTGDQIDKARSRATELGVSEDQFSSFMDEKGYSEQKDLKKSPMVMKTADQMKAAQDVMFADEFGTEPNAGLKARQDPNYVLGSGSPLNKPAQSIGTESGAMRRASRRLMKGGHRAQAGQMAMMAEMARLGEPSIMNDQIRGQQMAQRMVAGREAQKQDKLAAGIDVGMAGMSGKEGVSGPEGKAGAIKKARKRVSAVDQAKSDFDERRKKRQKDRQLRTQEFRDRNQNGVEDRDEDDGLDEITYYKPFQNL